MRYRIASERSVHRPVGTLNLPLDCLTDRCLTLGLLRLPRTRYLIKAVNLQSTHLLMLSS